MVVTTKYVDVGLLEFEAATPLRRARVYQGLVRAAVPLQATGRKNGVPWQKFSDTGISRSAFPSASLSGALRLHLDLTPRTSNFSNLESLMLTTFALSSSTARSTKTIRKSFGNLSSLRSISNRISERRSIVSGPLPSSGLVVSI